MIHSSKPEEILAILKEYEKEDEKRKMKQVKGQYVPYENMSTGQQETVDYVEEELGVEQHIAVLAVNQLGEDDAVELGTHIARNTISTISN